MDGILVIDKPPGPTSFETVRRVRLLLKVKKAGHTGTLDPSATGVLPVCLGEATKLAGFISQADKSYEAVIRLGVVTDTLDAAGKVVAQSPVPPLTPEKLEAVLAKFRGPGMQVPPMYSAVKIAGKRLYDHARAGEEISREPRAVCVHELSLIDFSATQLAVRLRCSKGFFVRSLAYDIGSALGCGAHVLGLRRTASGPFTLAQALSPTALEALWQDGSGAGAVHARLISLTEALGDWPAVQISPGDAVRVSHGLPIEVRASQGRVRVLSDDHRLLALAEVGADRRLKYLRVFV